MPKTPKFRCLNPPSLPRPMGYSQVAEVTHGRTVYIAGQVGQDASGGVASDFGAQVEQAFVNLRHALEAVGGSFADVVKLGYYCVESVPPASIAVVREVRDRFLNVQAPPVSTFVVVSRLVRPEWLIEIEAIAVVGD